MGIDSRAAAKAKMEKARRREQRSETTHKVFIGAFAAIPLGFLIMMIVSSSQRRTTVSVSYPGTSTMPSSVFDAVLPVLFPVILGVGVFAVAAVAVSKFIPFARKHLAVRAERKRSTADNTKRWVDLLERRDRLILRWSRYETDVALMIDYPVMTDYTDPVVSKVVTAMQSIRNAELLTMDPATPVYGSAMLSAVNQFEHAFTAAEKHARRYGQTKLDPREQRKLSAARTALNIILDEQSPAHEVEAAYKSLRGSLRGIIDLPQQAVIELESKARRELVSA